MDSNYSHSKNITDKKCFWRGKLTVPRISSSAVSQQQNGEKKFKRQNKLQFTSSGILNVSSLQNIKIKKKDFFNSENDDLDKNDLFRKGVDTEPMNNIFKVFFITFILYFLFVIFLINITFKVII